MNKIRIELCDSNLRKWYKYEYKWKAGAYSQYSNFQQLKKTTVLTEISGYPSPFTLVYLQRHAELFFRLKLYLFSLDLFIPFFKSSSNIVAI